MPPPTFTALRVLRVFLDDPAKRRYGLELMRVLNMASGSMYPLLSRLIRDGWLQTELEDVEPHLLRGRPRRRYYWLKPGRVNEARSALANAAGTLAPPTGS